MQRFRTFVDPYILAMFAMVGLAGVLPARGQGAEVAGMAANVGIVFLFFLYGARISRAEAWAGMAQWRLQLAVLATTFVLFPVLGLGLVAATESILPAALASGLMLLCVLPSTVQSSIAFTSIARGNVPAALCAASASNIVGVVLTPVLAGSLLQVAGAELSFGVFRDIMLQLLAPFVAGQLLRPLIGNWVTRNKLLLTFADRGSILLIIYVAFSRGVVSGVWDQVRLDDLAGLLAILAGLLASVLILTWTFGRKVLGFKEADAIVLQFCGSQKSLASGLPIATVLFAGPSLGLIVLPLMLYHQMQLVVCAVLTRRYSARTEGNAEAAIASLSA
nr:bile acid:sodium symporter family protein [Sphingomonas sp. CDS-1]